MPPIDPARTIAFTTQGMWRRKLPLALGVAAIGLSVFAFNPSPTQRLLLAGWVLVLAGFGGVAYIFLRQAAPGTPLYALGPRGADIRIPFVETLHIPWSEVRSIETIRHQATGPRARGAVFDNLTVLAVSGQFYDQNLHVSSAFMRGPYWGNNFIERGDSVLVALHHELVDVDPARMRAEAEARWTAFRAGGGAAAAAGPTIILRGRGGGPLHHAASAIALAAIAVLGANFIGLWETDDQRRARLFREEWAAREQRFEAERRAIEEVREQLRRDMERLRVR